MESASYQLVLDHVAGFCQFSKDVMVLAAGNTPEHSSVAHMISTPLADRFKIIRIDPPTVDEWADWMSSTHGDKWDRRTYGFLKAFESENYLLQVPERPETLEAYPTPRSWTRLALELAEGFDSDDDICGLIGYDVGQRFQAFLKVRVDLEELLKEPGEFLRLGLDGKYMACVLLGSWIEKNMRNVGRAFPLIDAMAGESREYLVVTCLSMSRRGLVEFLRRLFEHNRAYAELLGEVALKLKDALVE